MLKMLLLHKNLFIGNVNHQAGSVPNDQHKKFEFLLTTTLTISDTWWQPLRRSTVPESFLRTFRNFLQFCFATFGIFIL